MINSVVLNGRLTKDPELKYTPNNVAVAQFTLAVDRSFKSQNGKREADFINCVMWQKPAENFANFTHKGSKVGVKGRLQTRTYENQQGQRVYVTEVVCEQFDLLDSKKDNQRQNNGYQNQAPQQQANYQNQPQTNYQAQPNFQQPMNNGGITEDDVPF